MTGTEAGTVAEKLERAEEKASFWPEFIRQGENAIKDGEIIESLKKERDCALARFSGDNETQMQLGVFELDYVNNIKLEWGQLLQECDQLKANRDEDMRLIEELRLKIIELEQNQL